MQHPTARLTHPLLATAAASALAFVAACGGGRHASAAADGVIASAPAQGEAPHGAPPAATNPVLSDVSYETAESVYVARDYPRAAAMFEAYTTRRPENPWGHYMLGLAAWRAGHLDRAQQAFEDALARDSQHVKSLVNLGRVLLEENRPAEARTRIDRALAIDSGLGETWRVLGRVEAQLGHTDSSVDAYRMAIKIDPRDVWAMNNLGLTLIDAGRYEDAVGPLAHAVQLDSGVPTFGNNLGIALERSGHLTAATQAYRAALAADSGYGKARVSLQRVDGRADADGVEPIDLSALGDKFAQDVAGWGGAGVVGNP